MTLLTSLVEVRTLSSDQPRSNFDQQKIEQAAQLIIAAEGIINPIIVSRTGINSFQVVAGHFEYYAAARARELNLEIGEAIAAYIIEDDNEASINEQVAIFRQPKIIKDNNNDVDGSDVNNLETRLTNLESRIDQRLEELTREYSQQNKQLEQEIVSLSQRLPEKIEPLTTFNEASLIELVSKLRPIYGSGSRNENIAQQIVEQRPYKSLIEVKEKINGLGDKTLLQIIDRWLYG